MKKIFMGLLALVLLVSAGMVRASAADAVKLKVKNKEWKEDAVFLKDGRLYANPEALENGARWKVSNKNGAFFAEVPVGKEKSSVRLPIGDDGLADLTFFASQAGLKYTLNEKKKEIKFSRTKERKKEKKKEASDILFMWDPDNAYDSAQPFFSASQGKRILSPTWGTYTQLSGGRLYFPISYVENAKSAGVGVMPLVNNDFDPEQTARLMRDEKAQKTLALSLGAYAEVYGLDGWNIDFENMDPKDTALFTGFIKNLSQVMRQNGYKLSLDVTAIGTQKDSFWSSCYDRKALASHVDYEIFMGYDQTAGGSAHAGPVAAYDWLDRSIRDLLREVPAKKLILGIPFYTRVWSGEDGAVRSDVLTLQYTDEFIRRNKVNPQWKKEEQQFFADWTVDGIRKRVWLEESRSIAEKQSLAEKYKLAGTAYWRYGFEDPAIYGKL